ncbi:hypothetical protein [Marinobacter qingdaonensis]|uniref:Uncharacterized protein n=1 Tax=Marinobacter qingdaonensis TaxID=3108486 RepID=A0ABU5P1L8_9GAMM|nr:hypothetical protein [Marinobacter sp. ASW11-75]MEA1081968.1 hypothetical protein [Marinobacter sp. ASW11-75]
MMISAASPINSNCEKYFGKCKETGAIVYRFRGHDFGNGCVDSDESPIWIRDDSAPMNRPFESELLLLPEIDRTQSHDPSRNRETVLEQIRERMLEAEVLMIALANPRTYQHSDSEDVLITAMAEKAREYQSAAAGAMELLTNDPEPWKG